MEDNFAAIRYALLAIDNMKKDKMVENNFTVMRCAIGIAYVVLVKAHMNNDPVPLDELAHILPILEKALAIQPRNCDLYTTAKEAHQAWLDDTDNWDEFGSPSLELHEWLLATYKPETKGENNENV